MKKLSIILFFILIGTLCNLGYAQRNHSVPKEIKEAFTAKTDTVGSHIIQYRETLISPEASDSAALVIFLHSAGGRGDDNLSHLGMPAVKDIYDYLKTAQYPRVLHCTTMSKNGIVEWRCARWRQTARRWFKSTSTSFRRSERKT